MLLADNDNNKDFDAVTQETFLDFFNIIKHLKSSVILVVSFEESNYHRNKNILLLTKTVINL